MSDINPSRISRNEPQTAAEKSSYAQKLAQEHVAQQPPAAQPKPIEVRDAEKAAAVQKILDQFEDEFDRDPVDLSIIKMILKLFIVTAKTVQNVMESQAKQLALKNEYMQGWTSKQADLPFFSSDEFKYLIPGDSPEDLKKRIEYADKMNLSVDRFRDLIRMNRDIAKDESVRLQGALQTTTDERMKTFDNLTTMLSAENMLYSTLWK